jgi:hypothetical protein
MRYACLLNLLLLPNWRCQAAACCCAAVTGLDSLAQAPLALHGYVKAFKALQVALQAG